MEHIQYKRKAAKYSEELPEGKFLKKGWASRDEQRLNRKSFRRKWKQVIKNALLSNEL